MKTIKLKTAYVYMWIHPITQEIFYVGMSENWNNGQRAKRDVMEIPKPTLAEQHAKDIFKLYGKKHKVHIFKKNMDLLDALGLEMMTIRTIGRRINGGTLLNNSDGGEHPRALRSPKEYSRNRISQHF